MTDLTGTTWVWNNYVNLSTMPYTKCYVKFDCEPYGISRSYTHFGKMSSMLRYYDSADYDEAYDGGLWRDAGYKTIHITGGSGATNENVIAWIEANATQVKTRIDGCNAWYLNNSVNMMYGSFTLPLISNGKGFIKFYFDTNSDPHLIKYGDTAVYTDGQGWTNQAYRTVIFETRPTDELLTWLQENATELSYSAEAWYFGTYPNTVCNTPVNFVSDGTQYSSLNDTGNILYYDTTMVWDDAAVGWHSQAYRTVIFETAPTGNLLTLLNANATKVAGTPQSQKTYIGVGGQAKSITNMYVGVNGVAKKITKAYIGVNGQAKKIF